MKLAALALLGLLAVSVFASIVPASALSAITFTTKTTFSTASTLPQVLYENGTNSVIALDGTGAGVFEKDVYSVAAGTVSSATTTLSGSGNTINSAAYMGPVDTSRYALSFASASSEDVTIPYDASFDITGNEITFGGWAYATADGQIMDMSLSGAGTDRKYGMYRVGTALGCTIQTNNGVLDSLRGSAFTANAWHHVVCAYDGSNVSWYVDGVNTDTGAHTGNIVSRVGQPLTFASFESSSFYLNGREDDMFVVADGLSGAQITSIYNGNAIPTDFDVFLDFNEGLGSVAQDRSGNGNDGTLQNTPTWITDVPTNSISRLTDYITGRDTATGNNGYGKINLSDLSEVADAYQTSALYPRNIAQSTTNLYSPLYNNTATNGALNLGIQTRALASYSEPVIYTGSAGNPAHGLLMDTSSAASATQALRSGGNTLQAEHVLSTSVLVGKKIDRATVYLSKTNSPTGTITIGVFDSSGNVVHTFGTQDSAALTGSQTAYTYLGTPRIIQSGDYIGVKFTGGDVTNTVDVGQTNADVFDSTNSVRASFAGSWTDDATRDLQGVFADTSNVKIAVYDGSPDTEYVFFESGASSLAIVKYTSSASTISTSLSHTAGEDYSIMQMSGKILIQTSEATYTLTTSTDAITTDSTTYLTRPPQTFSISPAARTYISAAYVANTETATLYNPSAGTSASDYVMIDDATAPTLTAYDSAKFYYLQTNDLTVEAANATATSWTIKEPGTQTDFTVTPYSEHVGISLVQNNTLFGDDVFQLVCDNGAYTVNLPYFATGSDADCTEWKVLATSGLSVGREIFGPFARTVDLVHTSPQTAYSFELSATDPTVFTLKSLYDGKIVDVNIFDASGQSQQRYLYGNCYSVQVINNNNGQVINPGQICANDATTKTLNLQTLTIPTNWTSTGWHYNVTRSFGTGNVTTSNIQFDTLYNPVSYTANVLVTDSYLTQYQTFQTWYNFTSVNATSTIAVTKPNNSTIYFIVYDANMIPRLTVASPGNTVSLVAITTAFAPLGDLFGIPVTAFFVILGAAIFVRSNSPFGVIVVTAIAGFMFATGILSISAAAWGGIMVVAALGAIYAIKRF